MTADFPLKEIFLNDYPLTLKNMQSPPGKLYLLGEMATAPDQRYLCVVGSRKPSAYGKECIARIVSGLQGYPISIVSGLAFGIDSLAHITALKVGLHCVAFPGSSLEWDLIYPREHVGLARKIIESGGALLSKWESDYPTGKWAFPARNVLMAGISHATLVIEAGKGSGSLMTAKHAEDFDRDVLAIPGKIEAPLSYGPHMLIKKGAILVESAEDVLRELGFKTIVKDSPHIVKVAPEQLDILSGAILSALTYEESTMDMLIERTGANLGSINEKISLLELRGLIRVDEGMIRAV